ncbi:hypothetical protein VIBNISFn118_110076 [Vibrio nigripulchritudo SFn118]|nr:hypothetical protein VIBNISFn118_110076 [Vibrio nigripulchritudo SFn118]
MEGVLINAFKQRVIQITLNSNEKHAFPERLKGKALWKIFMKQFHED